MKCPFDLKNKKAIIKFEEQDVFNPKNTIKGYINRRQGHLYGSLYITHVNGKKVPQVIYGTPKQHYPFDRQDRWEFPDADSIEIYEKLDGTNILSYVYTDGEKEYLTFKTRLRPTLGSSKFGNFFFLWNEMLKKYNLSDFCFNNKYNYSFELYGKRNKILVEYDVPLDTRLIFAIDNKTGKIIPPSRISTSIPKMEILNKLDKTDKEYYISYQKDLDNNLEVDEKTGIVKGREGTVWYFITDDRVNQIKCKPEGILKFHWSPNRIPYESIYTTCVNAFENFDKPCYEDVKQLLMEEFTEDKIDVSKQRILKILADVLFEKKLQFELIEKYNELGIDINEDKGAVMRHFAKIYPKEVSGKIFKLLMDYTEGLNE